MDYSSRLGLFTLISALLPAASLGQDQLPYRRPPAPIVEMLDRQPIPIPRVDPRNQRVLLIQRASMPTIDDLSEPMLRLAGQRINPRTNGRVASQQGRVIGLEIVELAGGRKLDIQVPDDPNLGMPDWSPDGTAILFAQTLPDGVELWVSDAATGRSRRLTDRHVNQASGGCQWSPDSASVLCRLVPARRGSTPQPSQVPKGPVIQQTAGARAQVRTYQDLLKDPDDVRVYEHYFTTQLVWIDIKSGKIRELGDKGVFGRTEISPDGRLLLVERITPPYSYQVPEYYFPKEVEVWSRDGKRIYQVTSLPLAEEVPIGGVRTGPRDYHWRPDQPATLVWVEALDGGDPKREVEARDSLMMVASPFQERPREIFRTGSRFRSDDWLPEDDSVFVTEYDRDRQWTKTWLLDTNPDGNPARLVWDRNVYGAYGDPGDFVLTPNRYGRNVILCDGTTAFLSGTGSSPNGDRPFLARFNLESFESEKVFECEEGSYERVLEVLSPDGSSILTQHETPESPPNLLVRHLTEGSRTAVTDFDDPARELQGLTKELLRYRRQDGVELSATLYLPPGYQKGERLPMLMWAYPREFNDPRVASQVRGSPYRFTRVSGSSHLFLLTQGYAILDGPAMPIVGEKGNDSFVEQLVMNARAAVDEVVRLEVTEPSRIAIGGHSYGAFMTANLLAHTDLFQAGIARSGAYNRTLTPFGFQNEKRTFWEASEVYFTMSPFMHADKINEPILLLHGEADNNSGTFPIQSQRLFHALKGLGGTARLVMLPLESHGYSARESVLHTLAEMIDWCDRWIGK